MLLLAGIALAVLLRKVLGRIALLLLVSGTLAYLLDPLSRFYRRRTRLAQGPCAALAFASAALALAVFLFFGVPALSRQLTALAQAAPQLVESFGEQLTRMTASLGRVGLPDEAVTVLRAQAARLLDAGAQFLMDRLVTFARGVSSLGYLVFAPVLAFYMLRDKRRLFSFLTIKDRPDEAGPANICNPDSAPSSSLMTVIQLLTACPRFQTSGSETFRRMFLSQFLNCACHIRKTTDNIRNLYLLHHYMLYDK